MRPPSKQQRASLASAAAGGGARTGPRMLAARRGPGDPRCPSPAPPTPPRRHRPVPPVTDPAWPVFAGAFALSGGLIIAIGAQNAYVLRQGLRRERVLLVVAFCAVADAALIALGVLGMAGLIGERPLLARLLAGAGVAFLTVYGLRALARARRPQSLQAAAGAGPATVGQVLSQLAAFTFLNPHVYLDTVLLVGSIGAQHPPALRAVFIAGAAVASLTWFTALGFGARALAPLFAGPRAWQVLDALIGVVMLALAASLLPLLRG